MLSSAASDLRLSPDDYFRPLHPEARDQGDPYVLTVPSDACTPFRFYTYVTGEDAVSARAFPVYGSNDLVHWQALGGSLQADPTRAHWAPCVQYLPRLDLPYVMLYSRAQGLGEQSHIGHQIRRAHSRRPQGPFEDSGHVLTPELDFAIDPDIYRAPDHSLKIAFAMDFVADAPLGTGIVEAAINDDLTQISSARRVLARASHAWHVYDPARRMPWKHIPNVNWEQDTVRWNTLEAPVGGLVSPRGQSVYLYSGGAFFQFYAVGALVEADGQLLDISSEGQLVIAPQETRGIFAPGHCCWIRGVGDSIYLMLHARFGSPQAPRQMCLAPLGWNEAGHPVSLPLVMR
jgi:hypothetical protein